MTRLYKRDSLIDGTGALNELGILRANGPFGQDYNLSTGDCAQVDMAVDGLARLLKLSYGFDASGVEEENLPYVVHPVDYTTVGAGVWKLSAAQFFTISVETIVINDPTYGDLMTAEEKSKLAGIADGAQKNPDLITEAEITAGTVTEIRSISPAALKFAVSANAGTVAKLTHADSPYTVLPSNRVILIDCTDGEVVLQFLEASTNYQGLLTLRKVDASTNAVQCTPQSGETIDEQAAFALTESFPAATFVQDGGSNWVHAY